MIWFAIWGLEQNRVIFKNVYAGKKLFIEILFIDTVNSLILLLIFRASADIRGDVWRREDLQNPENFNFFSIISANISNKNKLFLRHNQVVLVVVRGLEKMLYKFLKLTWQKLMINKLGLKWHLQGISKPIVTKTF